VLWENRADGVRGGGVAERVSEGGLRASG
jgi:hypothetical protein